jgi:ribonuclease D
VARSISTKRRTKKSHFNLLIDKTTQETFDLETPLTQKQIEYAAFDTRMPYAMRQAQMNIMTADQLLATTQIENDAIGRTKHSG